MRQDKAGDQSLWRLIYVVTGGKNGTLPVEISEPFISLQNRKCPHQMTGMPTRSGEGLKDLTTQIFPSANKKRDFSSWLSSFTSYRIYWTDFTSSYMQPLCLNYCMLIVEYPPNIHYEARFSLRACVNRLIWKLSSENMVLQDASDWGFLHNLQVSLSHILRALKQSFCLPNYAVYCRALLILARISWK